MPNHLDRERRLLLDWLRARLRDPALLPGTTDPLGQTREITERFLAIAREGEFAWEVVWTSADGHPGYAVHWTHRGASFVGFKQPPPEPTPEEALLAGCAALLENDWCRERLPKE